MPVFVYKAADRRGQTIDGVMDAPDARAVVERLQKDAYYPIKVTAHGERAPLFSLGGSRVGQRDLLALTQQLATLFEAGLPLDRALTILEELAPNPRVKPIVTDLLRSVRGGASSSKGLAKPHPRPFPRPAIKMSRDHWKGGGLGGWLSWDRAILKAPIWGGIALHVEAARFARTLGTMLRSGVPVLGALAVVGDMMSNQAVGGAVSRLSDGVKRGGTIAAGMQDQGMFPALAIHMVRVGEETGRMEEMLLKVADTFETDVRIEM